MEFYRKSKAKARELRNDNHKKSQIIQMANLQFSRNSAYAHKHQGIIQRTSLDAPYWAAIHADLSEVIINLSESFVIAASKGKEISFLLEEIPGVWTPRKDTSQYENGRNLESALSSKGYHVKNNKTIFSCSNKVLYITQTPPGAFVEKDEIIKGARDGIGKFKRLHDHYIEFKRSDYWLDTRKFF